MSELRADLRAMLVVARRELLERVLTKWFAIMTLVGPIGMVALVVIPAVIAGSSTAGTKIEIIDRSGTLGPAMVAGFAGKPTEWIATIVPADTPDPVELGHIRTKAISGFLTIPANALDGGTVIYRGDNASSQAINAQVTYVVTRVIWRARAMRAGIKEGEVDQLLAKVTVDTRHTNGETEGTSGMGAFFIAYIIAFVLYMVITLYGVAVMRSVVTEKTSRVMELMIAAVKPRALMGGKILGVGGAGLLQIAVWLTIGAITLAYRDTILGWFGVTATDPDALPPLGFIEIAVIVLYFALGFFFYSAMYAAVGAMVSSEQDTQQVQLPVTLLLIVGVVSLQVIANAPRGSSATIMSNVPFWSPLLMPMRYLLGGATLGEVAISLAILIVSTLLVVRVAAKIYRVGVLMYGKRPGIRELIRWLRY